MFLDRPLVNGIRRLGRALAHRPTPPGRAGPLTGRPKASAPHPGRRPGRDGFAGRFIQDMAAAANVAVGQNWPAPTTSICRPRTITAPGSLPRTVLFCSHCRQRPAGFLGQPRQRPDGAPPMVPVLLPGPEPGPLSRDPVR